MAEYKNLKIEQDGATAVLSICRPDALNALNSETIDELNDALTEIEANDDIKVLILTGGPCFNKKLGGDDPYRSFVAGADISEMYGFDAPSARKFGMKASVPFFKDYVMFVGQPSAGSPEVQIQVLHRQIDWSAAGPAHKAPVCILAYLKR